MIDARALSLARVASLCETAANLSDYSGEPLTVDAFACSLGYFRAQRGRDDGEVIFIGTAGQIDALLTDAGPRAIRITDSLPCRGIVCGVKVYEADCPRSGEFDACGAFIVADKTLGVTQSTSPGHVHVGIVRDSNVRSLICLDGGR